MISGGEVFDKGLNMQLKGNIYQGFKGGNFPKRETVFDRAGA